MSFTSALPANLVKYSSFPGLRISSDSAALIDSAILLYRTSSDSAASGEFSNVTVLFLASDILKIAEDFSTIQKLGYYDRATFSESATLKSYFLEVIDSCLSPLRYVSEKDEIRASDLNDLKTCFTIMSSVLKGMVKEMPIDDPYVDELDAILAKISYVKSGDIIMPEHHNYMVDALKKARDILSSMENYYKKQIELLSQVGPLVGITLGFGLLPQRGGAGVVSYPSVKSFTSKFYADFVYSTSPSTIMSVEVAST